MTKDDEEVKDDTFGIWLGRLFRFGGFCLIWFLALTKRADLYLVLASIAMMAGGQTLKIISESFFGGRK